MAASWPIVCSTCIQHQNNPNYQIIYFKLYTSNVFPFFPFFWYFSYIYTNRNYGDYGVQLLSSKYLTSSTQIDTLNLFFIPVHVELLLDVKYFAPGMHSSSVSVIWNIISCNVCDHVNILLQFLPPLHKQTLCAQKGVTNLTKCACTKAS